jgi:sulfur carrier protein
MKLGVNGQSQDHPDGMTGAGLLAALQMKPAFCAVEINRELSPRSQHETVVLGEGDVVEIVTLVGGG